MHWGGIEKIQIKTKIPRLVTHPSPLLKTGTPTVFRDSKTSRGGGAMRLGQNKILRKGHGAKR